LKAPLNIFTQTVHADTPTNPNPYNFRQNGFTDAEIEKYEVESGVVDYMENGISVNGKIFTKVDALGDPSTLNLGSPVPDPNKDDLLHCFVNHFRSIEEPDDICKGIGYITNDAGMTSDLPTDVDIQKIYDKFCAANQISPCPFKTDDELLRYRLYIAYVHTASSLYSYSTDDDGSSQPGAQ
jgi:hypothetical protein